MFEVTGYSRPSIFVGHVLDPLVVVPKYFSLGFVPLIKHVVDLLAGSQRTNFCKPATCFSESWSPYFLVMALNAFFLSVCDLM